MRWYKFNDNYGPIEPNGEFKYKKGGIYPLCPFEESYIPLQQIGVGLFRATQVDPPKPTITERLLNKMSTEEGYQEVVRNTDAIQYASRHGEIGKGVLVLGCMAISLYLFTLSLPALTGASGAQKTLAAHAKTERRAEIQHEAKVLEEGLNSFGEHTLAKRSYQIVAQGGY